MKRATTIDDLSRTSRVLLGAVWASLGLLAAWLVHTHPQGLRAPAWLALTACACFVVAGVAVGLHAFISRHAYAWALAGLLAMMTGVPAWLALGPGERQCRSPLPMLSGESGCRIAFGAGAVILAGATVLAVVLARKAAKNARAECGQ